MLITTSIDKSSVTVSASPNAVKYAELNYFFAMVKTKTKTNSSEAPEKRFGRKNQ